MKKTLFLVVALLALTSTAWADTLNASGGTWQNWVTPTGTGKSGAFWDIASWDGAKCNVGFWLQGPGSGCENALHSNFYTSSPVVNDPAVQYFGAGAGTFTVTTDGNSRLTSVAGIGASSLSPTTEIGWFNLADPTRKDRHALVTGVGVVPGFTIPSGNYGFYANVTLPGFATQTYYSDTLEGGRNQFMVFDITLGGHRRFVLGFEDLVMDNPWVHGSDYDYNDMMVVLNYTPVPEPASMLLLGTGLLGVGGLARRRSRKS